MEVARESAPDGRKVLFIEGIMAQSDHINKNRRRYPYKGMCEAVEAYNADFVLRNRAIGELNHPNHLHPNPERASHVIRHLAMEGKNAVGRAEVLDNLPCGKILYGLIDRNVQMGVSTRGGCQFVKESTGITRCDNYKMFAIDAVHNPSAEEAFVRGVMEGFDRLEADGDITMEDLDSAFKLTKLDKTDAVRAFGMLISKLGRS